MQYLPPDLLCILHFSWLPAIKLLLISEKQQTDINQALALHSHREFLQQYAFQKYNRISVSLVSHILNKIYLTTCFVL